MLEFFQAAFQPMNLMLTILMILVLIYWITVILGALDFDFLDFDLDGDVDIDADVDADIDLEGGGGSGGKGFVSFISWFNIGKIPFMIVFSIAIFTMWMSSILLNHYIGNTSFIIAFLLYIPIFLFAMFITKIATDPLIPVFDKLNFRGEKAIDLEGKTGLVLFGIENKEVGQADIVVGDKHFKITISSLDGLPIRKGDKIVIIEKKEKFYLVNKVGD